MARPRKYADPIEAKAAAIARADAGRRRIGDAGGAILQIRLTADAKEALDQMVAAGESKSGVISRLLEETAKGRS